MHRSGSQAAKQPQLGEAHGGRALELSEVDILNKAVHNVEQEHQENHSSQRIQGSIVTRPKVKDCHGATEQSVL